MRHPKRLALMVIFTFWFALCLQFPPKMIKGDKHNLHLDETRLDRKEKENNSCISCRLEGPIPPDDPQLIKLTRKKYIIPPNTRPYALAANNDNRMEYNMYRSWVISWNYLNEVITTLFSDEPPGFFVEAGALDGEYISNTLDLERLRGWEGLLVEVDEELFSRLQKKNRKAWISNTCLATFPYPHKTILVKFENHNQPNNGFALPVRGYNALIGSKDLDERMEIGLPIYQAAQCLPLETLLLAIDVTHVNLISLDVEGVEMGVLNSFFNSKGKITVDVWIVEHKHPNSSVQDADQVNRDFIYWFQSKGYTLYTYGSYSPADYIFIRNDSSIYEKSFSSRPSKFIKDF